MHSHFNEPFNATPAAAEAKQILSRCVHCGFCNAACPTYQLQSDELDGPRGRIYLIKQLLEKGSASRSTQQHLDNCLTCRSCETACPSGVKFGRLIDISRPIIAAHVSRSWSQQTLRRMLLWGLPYPQRLQWLAKIAYAMRPLLTNPLKAKLPSRPPHPAWPKPRHARQVLLLEGCVQRTLAPHIDALAAQVLDQVGISAIRQPQAGCCGALAYHLGAQEAGLAHMRQLLDSCWPIIQQGVEAVVMSASGCGLMLKEYAHLLRDDPDYAEQANKFSMLCRDLSEILSLEDCRVFKVIPRKVAFQAPCTLQHGQQLSGVVEKLLCQLNLELTTVADAHLCCGSAGTYALLQPALAGSLRTNKLRHLQNGQPDVIATANIGCLLHLQEKADIPVLHWLELLVPATH